MDKIYANQDAFIEWQANEGASELFVPCKVLLPLIKSRYGSLTTSSSIRTFRTDMAELFGVTETVIEYRFDSLKYEINQYMQGVPIDEIKILSVSQQKKFRINSKSINDIEKELVKKEIKECGRTHFINIESVLTCI
jgi:Zn-dependent peptidase ImmA (M78 family)